VNGVFSDEDIARVRELALAARAQQAKPRRRAAPRKRAEGVAEAVPVVTKSPARKRAAKPVAAAAEAPEAAAPEVAAAAASAAVAPPAKRTRQRSAAIPA
jgi:hypothetical protein